MKVAKTDNDDDEVEDSYFSSNLKCVRDKDYDLNDFLTLWLRNQLALATLLRFISKLVSNGKISKPSLSLLQSMQKNILSTQNHIPLGLGMKLYHKLVNLLISYMKMCLEFHIRKFDNLAAQYNSYTFH